MSWNGWNERSAPRPEPKPLLHPNLAELYRRKVAELETFLAGDESDPAAVDLIRSLVDEIILTPSEDQLRVDLRGDLAAIFAIATDKSPPGKSRTG